VNRPLRRIEALGSLAITAGAAALAPAVAGAQATPFRVTLASSANDDVTPVLYALSKGWFRDAGLDIDLQASTNGAAVAAAVAGGTVDFGRSNVVPLITAHARGIPFTLVAPSGSYFDGAGSSGRVIVNKSSAVQRPRDLNGLVVSVASLNDIQTIAARAWIDKDGGNSASVKFLEANGQESAVALDTGRIDAASLVAPLLTQLVDTGKYRVLGDPTSGVASRLIEAAWFSLTAYTAKNPAVVKKFSTIVGRASAFCNDHPEQTVGLLAAFSKIDAAVIAHAPRDKYDLTLVPSDLQPLIDASARYGVIPRSFDAREFIDPNALS
jgi:NitT/TauT family transport system substrate-binding protein